MIVLKSDEPLCINQSDYAFFNILTCLGDMLLRLQQVGFKLLDSKTVARRKKLLRQLKGGS